MSRDPIGYEGSKWNLLEYVGGNATNVADPMGKEWWNPFTWWDVCWDDCVDQEIAVVAGLNARFGTHHSFLHQFTPEERAMIESALNTKIEWDEGAFKLSCQAYKQRECTLKQSKGCLIVAGVADGAAAGLVGCAGAGVTQIGIAPIGGGAAIGGGMTAAHRELLRKIQQTRCLLDEIVAKIAEADLVLAELRARGAAGAIRIPEAMIMNLETRMTEVWEILDALLRQLRG